MSANERRGGALLVARHLRHILAHLVLELLYCPTTTESLSKPGMMMRSWTPKAQRRWEQIPPDRQQLVLTHSWCPACQQPRQMVLTGGTIIAGDLVITGTCTVCSQRTARLLEGEVAPSSGVERPFQTGEQVIWLKRLPGGTYVVPLGATVVARTPKRIKIVADDDGQLVTRYVPIESLQRQA